MPSAAAGAEPHERRHYHPVGITFHWLMALFIFVQLWWGWRTQLLPAGYEKLEAYGVHALLGVIILALAFLRAGWRIIAPFVLPELEKPEDLPGWQRLAAEATHFALYGLMFLLPLTGWVMLSASTAPIELMDGVILPALPFAADLGFVPRAHLEQAAETAHLMAVLLLMALIAVHVGAALKHHFIDKDDVLARMIPWLSRTREVRRKAAPQGAR